LSARDRLLAGIAGQLGNPHGALGRFTGRMLNRGNKTTIESAIRSLDARPSEVLADLGFGGGEGLAQLLKVVDGRGTVVGVDRSSTMLNAARRRFHKEVATGRLQLHEGSMEKLPLAEQSIDAAISVNTVYFVPDLAPLFRELARVLRPNGRLVMGVGDPTAMARMPFAAHGFILRPIDEITTIAKTAADLTLRDNRLGTEADSYHLLCARIGES
jgi:arsenite methyltransferase